MTKELFVSSTPHETKVGMVEDDQLAEVYLERENEYTLAGSIYKGRVTRVLPGMQSAFVDIGLERDAFLYVSDFMELENQDEDLDELPPISTVQDFQSVPPRPAAPVEPPSEAQSVPSSQPAAAASAPREGRERGGYRSRRRRDGYRDRDSRSQRPAQPEVRAPREDFGPPAGYEPILLPGESISKYRDRGPVAARPQRSAVATRESPETLADAFPQDEPLFAAEGSEPASSAVDFRESEQPSTTWGQPPSAVRLSEEESAPITNYEGTGVPARSGSNQQLSSTQAEVPEVGSDEWDRNQRRLHEMNVAAIFGGEQAEPSPESSET